MLNCAGSIVVGDAAGMANGGVATADDGNEGERGQAAEGLDCTTIHSVELLNETQGAKRGKRMAGGILIFCLADGCSGG